MMHETMKRLTNDDLANVCGGQIYKFFLEDNKTPKYVLATLKKPVIYNSFLDAVRDAPNYMYVNIVKCASHEEAVEKATIDADIYSVISVFPFI